MSLATDIADAVAAELNGAVFSQTFTAVRSVLPRQELAALSSLKVTVVPRAVEITNGTRTARQYDVVVDIGVQKKVGSDVDSDVASLGDLVDEITEYLCERRLSELPYAMWVEVANDPLYDVEHLTNEHVFTSVLSVTYRAIKG